MMMKDYEEETETEVTSTGDAVNQALCVGSTNHLLRYCIYTPSRLASPPLVSELINILNLFPWVNVPWKSLYFEVDCILPFLFKNEQSSICTLVKSAN